MKKKQNGNKTILVTGATGNQGGAVARELLAHGHRVHALTRKPQSDAARAIEALGARIVRADFDDADSLRRAFDGVWGVYAMQNTWEAGVEREEEQGKRVARVAHESGVQHFVYASVGSADQQTGIPHFENKMRIEETVQSLGFPSYTVLRPVFFMENWLSPWFKPGIDDGKLLIALKPETRLQMIAVEDIGRYGRFAFEQPARVNGRAIDIAGDELTMPEVAGILSEVTGHRVTFQRVPIAEVRKGSDDFATMLEWFDAVGYDADIEGNAKEFRIPPITFEAWARKVNWSVPAHLGISP